ncbi:hypothetical protein [Nocardioides montaniterrae]
MTATEPNGWELKRSIDQLRSDVEKKLDANRADAKEDTNEVRSDINGVGSKIDGLYRVFASVSEVNALAGRVATLESRADKRSERMTTIWLGIGLTAFTSLTGLAGTVVTILAQK